jgi:hypothetical protein
MLQASVLASPVLAPAIFPPSPGSFSWRMESGEKIRRWDGSLLLGYICYLLSVCPQACYLTALSFILFIFSNEVYTITKIAQPIFIKLK